jgi:hypothetical protein
VEGAASDRLGAKRQSEADLDRKRREQARVERRRGQLWEKGGGLGARTGGEAEAEEEEGARGEASRQRASQRKIVQLRAVLREFREWHVPSAQSKHA